LNQVERWFALITQRAIRRGSFGSVKDLVEKIGSFVHHYNRSHRPFVWTATTDDSQAVLLNIFPLLEELPERFHSVILSQAAQQFRSRGRRTRPRIQKRDSYFPLGECLVDHR
jgi:hypothetical protein